jgi:molybdopterin synthase sulfur carrier subunit
VFPSGFGDVNAGNRRVSDPPNGVIRYWAAAREAAGCAEESYAAATLEQALASAIAAHGPALARVLARCAFVVDGTPVSRRDPATVRLAAGGTIEVLPPFAGGGGCDDAMVTSVSPVPPAGFEPVPPVSASSSASARAVLIATLAALSTSLFALVVLGASSGGRLLLAAALLVVQLALVLGWFRSAHLNTVGQASGAFAAMAASVAADIVMLRTHDRANVRGLAGVLAGLVILAFVIQLARRDGRDRLTNALAASVASGALAIAMSVLLAVRGGPHGTTLVAVALTAVAVGVLPVQPQLTLWLGIPAGLVMGAGAGLLASHQAGAFGLGTGAVVALVSVALAVGARASLAKVPPGVVAWPVAAALPLVVVPPAVLVVARIMVG